MSHPMRWMLLLAGLASGPALSAADAAATTAVPALAVAPPASRWVERKLDYTYMGFTTHFSCDGLRDTVREVLLALGARKSDLKIYSRGCARLEGPEPFPGVAATFSVLVPVAPGEAGQAGAGAPQATRWQSVDLVRLNQSGRDHAPCELLEQLKDKALPLFTSRNLVFQSTCVPHDITLGEIQFKVEVLRPAPAAGPAAAGATPAA